MKGDRSITPIRDHKVYNENPFVNELAHHIVEKGNKRIKKVITQAGGYIDRETGESIDGEDLFIGIVKIVDQEQFIKVYHDQIKKVARLSDRAVSILTIYIARQLGKESLDIVFDIDDCERETQYSRSSIYRALGELLDANVLGRTKYQWKYYINPKFIFNGSRINVIERYIKEGTSGTMKSFEKNIDILRLEEGSGTPDRAGN